MAQATPSLSDIKLYRTLLIVAGAAYFLFWFIIIAINPEAFDPILGRAVVSSMLLGSMLLTYKSSFFYNNIIRISYGLSYILTFYYIFLLIENHYSNTYCTGMMIIIFGGAMVFKESGSLLIFLITCILSVGAGYFFMPGPGVNLFWYLSIVGTTGFITYLALSMRLKMQEQLATNNLRLEDAYKEINEQKKIVDIKNTDITDSINYAKKIQQAIVPSKFGLEELINESFIFYRVKDIVSGDFYWYHNHEDELVIASVDCTGHGVPGALMSMIGITLLNQTVNLQGIRKPDKILSNLQKEIYTYLQRGSNDGMDIAICNVNRKKMTLSFAGAMTRIIMIRDNIANEIKGDRFSVSCNSPLKSSYTDHTVELRKGDVFYLFTDGYADQFGGTKQKKFMYKRMEALLVEIHQKDVLEQKKILDSTLNEWKGRLEQIDDILVIGFRI